MNKQMALESIDWILVTLHDLEKAIERNDRRAVQIDIQAMRQEVKNLRDLVEIEKAD